MNKTLFALAALLAATTAQAQVAIGSGYHYQTDESAMPLPPTQGPVDCDIQAPTFAKCLSSHAAGAVNLGDIQQATDVVIDADGTVHLIAK